MFFESLIWRISKTIQNRSTILKKPKKPKKKSNCVFFKILLKYLQKSSRECETELFEFQWKNWRRNGRWRNGRRHPLRPLNAELRMQRSTPAASFVVAALRNYSLIHPSIHPSNLGIQFYNSTVDWVNHFLDKIEIFIEYLEYFGREWVEFRNSGWILRYFPGASSRWND